MEIATVRDPGSSRVVHMYTHESLLYLRCVVEKCFGQDGNRISVYISRVH